MPHINELLDLTVEVFCVYRGRVLLRRHDKFGRWLGVGGHVERDEDPDQAAHREVLEEVGLEIELLGATDGVPADPRNPTYRQLVPPAFVHRDQVAPNHEHVVLTFFARAGSDKVVPSGPDASHDWRWVTREALAHMGDLHANVRYYAERALAAADGRPEDAAEALPTATTEWPVVRDVRQWMVAAGIHVGEVPTVDIPTDAREMACALIDEEAGEFREAVQEQDLVGIADAVADLVWVVVEAGLKFGIPMEEVFDEVRRSNQTKLEGGPVLDPSGKITKGPNYSPPDLRPVLAAHRKRSSVDD